jgi:hypothetical protein
MSHWLAREGLAVPEEQMVVSLVREWGGLAPLRMQQRLPAGWQAPLVAARR